MTPGIVLGQNFRHIRLIDGPFDVAQLGIDGQARDFQPQVSVHGRHVKLFTDADACGLHILLQFRGEGDRVAIAVSENDGILMTCYQIAVQHIAAADGLAGSLIGTHQLDPFFIALCPQGVVAGGVGFEDECLFFTGLKVYLRVLDEGGRFGCGCQSHRGGFEADGCGGDLIFARLQHLNIRPIVPAAENPSAVNILAVAVGDVPGDLSSVTVDRIPVQRKPNYLADVGFNRLSVTETDGVRLRDGLDPEAAITAVFIVGVDRNAVGSASVGSEAQRPGAVGVVIGAVVDSVAQLLAAGFPQHIFAGLIRAEGEYSGKAAVVDISRLFLSGVQRFNRIHRNDSGLCRQTVGGLGADNRGAGLPHRDNTGFGVIIDTDRGDISPLVNAPGKTAVIGVLGHGIAPQASRLANGNHRDLGVNAQEGRIDALFHPQGIVLGNILSGRNGDVVLSALHEAVIPAVAQIIYISCDRVDHADIDGREVFVTQCVQTGGSGGKGVGCPARLAVHDGSIDAFAGHQSRRIGKDRDCAGISKGLTAFIDCRGGDCHGARRNSTVAGLVAVRVQLLDLGVAGLPADARRKTQTGAQLREQIDALTDVDRLIRKGDRLAGFNVLGLRGTDAVCLCILGLVGQCDQGSLWPIGLSVELDMADAGDIVRPANFDLNRLAVFLPHADGGALRNLAMNDPQHHGVAGGDGHPLCVIQPHLVRFQNGIHESVCQDGAIFAIVGGSDGRLARIYRYNLIISPFLFNSGSEGARTFHRKPACVKPRVERLGFIPDWSAGASKPAFVAGVCLGPGAQRCGLDRRLGMNLTVNIPVIPVVQIDGVEPSGLRLEVEHIAAPSDRIIGFGFYNLQTDVSIDPIVPDRVPCIRLQILRGSEAERSRAVLGQRFGNGLAACNGIRLRLHREGVSFRAFCVCGGGGQLHRSGFQHLQTGVGIFIRIDELGNILPVQPEADIFRVGVDGADVCIHVNDIADIHRTFGEGEGDGGDCHILLDDEVVVLRLLGVIRDMDTISRALASRKLNAAVAPVGTSLI